jgi:hypothetical protein
MPQETEHASLEKNAEKTEMVKILSGGYMKKLILTIVCFLGIANFSSVSLECTPEKSEIEMVQNIINTNVDNIKNMVSAIQENDEVEDPIFLSDIAESITQICDDLEETVSFWSSAWACVTCSTVFENELAKKISEIRLKLVSLEYEETGKALVISKKNWQEAVKLIKLYQTLREKEKKSDLFRRLIVNPISSLWNIVTNNGVIHSVANSTGRIALLLAAAGCANMYFFTGLSLEGFMYPFTKVWGIVSSLFSLEDETPTWSERILGVFKSSAGIGNIDGILLILFLLKFM